MELEAAAILGHNLIRKGLFDSSTKSTYVCTFLGDWSGDSTSFHLALVVNDDAGIVLKVDKCAVLTSIDFTLTDHDSLQN
jgi:hypothetical protein